MKLKKWIAASLIAACVGEAFAKQPAAPKGQPETEQAQPQQTAPEPAPAPQQQAPYAADYGSLCGSPKTREEGNTSD